MTPEFLAAVKAGRIEGLAHEDNLKHGELLWVDDAIPCFLQNGLDLEDALILCNFLRDWFTAKGWKWMLNAGGLVTWKSGIVAREDFNVGSPLEWHMSAAMHVLACEDGAL